jgi:outer membrane usher protein FimD/PapC
MKGIYGGSSSSQGRSKVRTASLIFPVLVLLTLLLSPDARPDEIECTSVSDTFVLGSFGSVLSAESFLQKTLGLHPALTEYLRISSQEVSESVHRSVRYRVVVSSNLDVGSIPFCLSKLLTMGYADVWKIDGYLQNKNALFCAPNSDVQCEKEAPIAQPYPVARIDAKTPESLATKTLASVPEFLTATTQELPIQKVMATLHKKPSNVDWVPEGFEALNEPEETEIDLFYGGFYLTSVHARFTSIDIEILDVDHLVSKLDDLKDPAAFRGYLNSTFYNNSGKICQTNSAKDCGSLTPVAVDVIFDRSRLRLDLFIASDLLRTRTVEQLAFLPPSDAGFSMLDYLSVFTSGSSGGQKNYNVANTTILSFAENRVQVRSNFTNSNQFSIDSLVVQREFQGKDYQAGIFRKNAGNFVFMKDALFVGATIASSLITRQDLGVSLGNEIEVFLDSRSRVEIYKDGRLVSTQFYDVGNQIINTSNLPGGAYDVELKIVNSAGIERSESRFYSKSSKLAPRDQSLYFLQIGEKIMESDSERILPTSTGKRLLRAGISKRLADSFGADAGFSVDEASTMLEVSAFKQGESYELRSIFAYDSLEVSALDLNVRIRFDNADFFISTRKIWSDVNVFEEKSQIGQAALQTRLTGTWRTPYGSLNAFYRSSRANDQEKSTNYGFRWNGSWFSGAGSLNSSLELSRNDGENLLLLTLNYRLQKDRWVHAASARYRDQGNQNDAKDGRTTGHVSSDWRNARDSANQYQVGLRVDSQNEGTFESRIAAKGNLGQADLTTEYRNAVDDISYSGSIKTSFAATRGSFGFGGDRQALSGFLVRARGGSDGDSAVSVIVDGSKRASINLNSTRFVPASEYDVHEISFLTEGDSLLNVDAKIYRKTLYPGNVIEFDVEAKQILVVIGRILSADGEPISNGLLLDVEGLATSDEEGYFQAEMAADIEIIKIKKGGNECEITIGAVSRTGQVVLLGDRVCE